MTHKYFDDYMKKNNIIQNEPILLYRKELPEFHYKETFQKKCELIKLNRGYYGHIIG